MKWLLERLKEPSTYRGLVLLGGAAGLTISPEMWNAIVALLVAAMGVYEVVRKER